MTIISPGLQCDMVLVVASIVLKDCWGWRPCNHYCLIMCHRGGIWQSSQHYFPPEVGPP